MSFLSKVISAVQSFHNQSTQNWYNQGEESKSARERVQSDEFKSVIDHIKAAAGPVVPTPLWCYPIVLVRVTSPYGWRKLMGRRVWHNGVDYSGSNTYALAPTECVIKTVLAPDKEYPVKFKYNERSNQFELIRGIPEGRAWTPYVIAEAVHEKVRFGFKHVDPLVKPGDHLVAGQNVAKIGNFGYSMGAHLHFEVYLPSGNTWKETNPVAFMAKKVKAEASR